MKISELSIKRPVTTLMVVFIILILGFVSLSRLSVDLLPSFNLPYAVVSTSYSGAGPQEVEGIVSKNIERVMATVNNVKSIRSVSSAGSSLVILEFNDGTNMDFATLDMREKLDMIKSMLPEGVSSPMVLRLNPNMMPIMYFGVSQKGKEVGQLKLWVEDVLKPRLERIDGVASVNISGGEQQEVKVVVDPDKLSAKGLSMTQIVSALRMENINAPGGVAADGQYDLLVRTTGEFRSIDEIRNIPIVSATGASFLLEDLAQIEEGVKEANQYSKINGQDSLSIQIQKESGANTVRVADKVNQEMEKIKEDYKEVQIMTVLDQSKYIKDSISTVSGNALIGGVLAVIILLLFLKNFSPTLVIATSIPISVIATFILIYFAHITLNIISLGGLALGVGMLVDNSIVVLENIYRMRQKGLNPEEAAAKGSSQVSMAIIASTLTTICVFLPIVFVEGITAQIFKELALTVTFSLVASLGVALTLVPMLSSRVLKNENFQKRNKLLDWIDGAYQNLLKWALAHRKSVVALTILAFGGSLALLPFVGTEFFPTADEGQIDVKIQMPRGTRFDETVDIVKKVESRVGTIPEVETIQSSIGGGQLGRFSQNSAADSGSLTLVLKPLKERSKSTAEVGEEIRQLTADLPGAEIQVSAGSSLMGGSMGGAGDPVSIEIKGEDLNTLQMIAEDIVGIVKQTNGTREVRSSFEEGAPELRVVLDRMRASQYGINVAMVSAAVQSELQGTVATRYKVNGRELDVRVQTPYKGDRSIQDVGNILIPSPLGTNVPLSSIASLDYEKGPVQIERMDQSRVVTVSAALSGRSLGDVVKDIEAKLKDYQLPQGYSYEFGGENKQLTESFSNLKLALILGVILVYMVMASQFESLVYPFIIMFTVPLAFTGAFTSLWAARLPLSVPGYLGMVMLAGIVVNNGIVLVDYINTLRKGGMDRDESILRAGPTRLRPILMTTLTTILGLLPLALGFGEGTEMEIPLAVTVIGGLSLSTVLTLVVVPVIYTLMDDLGSKFRRKPSPAKA